MSITLCYFTFLAVEYVLVYLGVCFFELSYSYGVYLNGYYCVF